MKKNQDPVWKLVLMQLFMASWVLFSGWCLVSTFRSSSMAESLPVYLIPEQTPLSLKIWLARLIAGALSFLILVYVIRSSFTLWRMRSLTEEPIQPPEPMRAKGPHGSP